MILIDMWEWIKYVLTSINPLITERVSFFEAIAIVLGLVGIAIAYLGIIQATKRLNHLIASKQNGVLRLIADENLRVERNRRNLLISVLIASFTAATVPPQLNTEYRWATAIISFTFILLVFFLSTDAYRTFLYCKELNSKVEELDRESQIDAIKGNRRTGDRKDV